MSITVPQWLKLPHPRQPIARYEPENLLFIPQRRVVCVEGLPCLLDGRDRAYWISRCGPPELEHLAQGASFITATGCTFSIYRQGWLYVCSDGQRQVYLDLATEALSAQVAAQTLATLFDGAIYSEEVA
jgi:hypothetical protein